MPDLRRTRLVEIAIVLFVCAFLFIYGLGSFGLVGADEPRYAQIGAEMLARHDWIVPTLNGTPWLEKPALLYWADMASYAIFGIHGWAARLPVALMAVAMVLAIYIFVRRRRSEWALDAALITASMAGMVGFARAASTDMPLTACLTIALLAWWEWLSGHPRDRRWLLAFYLFAALGMLAKGPVSPFLAGVIVLAYVVVTHLVRLPEAVAGRPPMLDLVWKTLWWPGILLFLVISLPWYIAVQLKTGDFFRVFILEHNLERFGTNLYQHHQPFWYYVPVVLALVMPWTAIFIAGLVDLVRSFRIRLIGDPETLFLALWFVIPVLFFSASQSKLPGYVLPAVPPAALLIIGYLGSRQERRLPAILATAHAILCGFLFSAVLLAPHFLVRVPPSTAAIATAAIAGMLVAVFVFIVLFRRGVHLAHAVTLLPVLLGIAFVIKVASPAIDATQSARPIAQEIHRLNYPADAPVLLFHVARETDFGLPFYRGPNSAIDYDGGPLPITPALILARRGSLPALEAALPKNIVLAHVATFAPQNLDFYMASPAVR